MHTIACTFIGYIRPYLIILIINPNKIEDIKEPSIKSFSVTVFVFYSLMLTFLHHLILFSVDIFSFNDVLFHLLKLLISTIFSVTLIIISEFIIIKNNI